MAKGEVWNEVHTLFRIAGIKVVEARLFVAQDDGKPLASAYQMLVSLRVLGAQIDNDNKTNNFPVKEGDVTVPITVGNFKGTVAGKIKDFHGTDKDGNKSVPPGDASEKVAFTLEAIGKVTIPVNEILAHVPGIGFVLKALLSALPGAKVSFVIGTVPVDVPVHRQNGKVVLPAGAVVPEWWP
jgi:hypothetical protein